MVHQREILYIQTIAREKSYSRASEKLGVSQPALSQAVQKLEARLRFPLLQRRGRQMELTTAGRLFIDYGRPVLDAMETLEQKIAAIVDSKEGTLRIGVSQHYSEYHLLRFLPQFLHQFPGVTVKLFEDTPERLEALTIDETVDFCVVPLPLRQSHLEYQILHREDMVFALPCDHPLMGRLPETDSRGLPLIDLSIARDEPFIFAKRQRFTQMGLRLCDSAGFTPNIAYETLSWNTVRAFIESGLGVGFLPEGMAPQATAANRLVCCRIFGHNTSRPYAAIYKKKAALSPVALTFLRVAQEVFRFRDPAEGT